MSIESLIGDLTEAVTANTEIQAKILAKLTGDAKAPKTAEADEAPEKPVRRRRAAKADADDEAPAKTEKAPKTAEADEDPKAIFKAVGEFLDYGDDDNEEDEAEREARGRFVKKINNHFDVARAGEIPIKNKTRVLRWLKLFASGEKVDFEND